MFLDIGFHKTDSSSLCIGRRTPMTTRFKYFYYNRQLITKKTQWNKDKINWVHDESVGVLAYLILRKIKNN